MLADLFLSVADAVISYTIDKLDPAETLKTWLKRDPAKLAFQKALARTYVAFARQYPEYAASLFDQSFLSKEAVPEISKLLIRSQHPDPALLAQACVKSIGFDTHSEFCKRATKPASDFLAWLEAELKAEQAFQALFDSRALDSLPKIEAEIEKLTKELTRGLVAALKIASEYEKISINIGGDVIDSNIIIGDNNTINKYYYSGDFVSLNEYYIEPDSVFQRVRVDEFVGRDWLTAKVDTFLNDPQRKSGAFLLIGDAGVGKTSFMAHLVKERRYLHLFAEQVSGQAMLQRALQSLGSQLVTHYQIDPYKDRDTLIQGTVFPDFLERLLRLAASTLTHGEKIVIVCDALDEAGTFPDGNVFGLPNVLPDGVYFILSQRPVNTKLPNFEPRRFNLEAQGADNLQDMQAYLSAVAKRPEVAGQIRSKEYSETFFIQTLKEKSLGVWMYLHYIIKEIENGSRAPLDLENLPTGLIGYYADYWDDWRYGRKGRGKGEEAWNNLYSPLLTTLAAAQEAITVEQIIKWANVKATPREVTHLLNQSWRSFITEKENGKGKVYSPYHLSFRDFMTGRVDFTKLDPKRESLVRDLAEQTVEAHVRIVKAFEEECQGKWESLVEHNYPRLYLSAHLAGAGEYEKLINLLTEGFEQIRWAEARYKKEENYAGYISDLVYVWDYAGQKSDYALAVRCMLIENSIHSLAATILPELLAQLGKMKLWNYPRCLATIRESSKTNVQAESLDLILPDLPPLLLQEVLAVASEIKDEYDRAKALTSLTPHLNDELKSQALAVATEIKDEYSRAIALASLAPYLDDLTLKLQLAMATEIKDEYSRASILASLARHLEDLTLKSRTLQEALTAAGEIKDEYDRASALASIAPHLDDELLQSQVLQEALVTACKIKSESDHVEALASLAPHLNDELKSQLFAVAIEIQDEQWRASALAVLVPYLNDELKSGALAVVRKIKSESARARALADIAPHLNDELKVQVFQEALAAAREIKRESARARALAALAPHLNDELKSQALAAAREIQDEQWRAHALADLIPYLNDLMLKTQALQEALAVAREIKSKFDRTSALAALAPHLNDELKSQALQEALAAACEIKGEYDRANALVALAPHLNDELKSQALQEALVAVHDIKDEFDHALAALAPHLNDKLKSQALAVACEIKSESARARALTALAPHLNDELKPQALAAAREIQDEQWRAHALASLIPYLNDKLNAQTLVAAHDIKSEFHRARALVALAPHLNDELKVQALVVAREIKDESARARALASFAPYLNDELKSRALAAAREIEDKAAHAHALVALALHLNDELMQSQVFQEALAAAREIKSESARARALADIAPHLNDELMQSQMFQEALAAAREIKDEQSRANALADIAPHLNDELKVQALAVAIEIQDEEWRARALADIAPHLNDELKVQVFQEALAAAREIKDEQSRANALADIAPHLNDELMQSQMFQEALVAAYEIKYEFHRAGTLAVLALHLNDELMQAQVLEAAREIKSESARARALAPLTPYLNKQIRIIVLQEILYLPDLHGGYLRRAEINTWEEIEFEGLEEHIISFIRLVSQKDREIGIDVVGKLTPALIHFRGPDITGELLRAIMDTARWWP